MLCGSSDSFVVSRIADYSQPFVNVCCRRCGLVYANPRPTTSELAAYYQTQFIQGRHEIATVEQARERARRKGSAKKYSVKGLIEPLSSGSRVLEIGCSYGFLLNAIHQSIGCHVEGVEPSEVSGAFAQEEFGFPVYHGTAESYLQKTPIPEEKFDLIILYHVLEHIEDPVEVLTRLGDRLAPSGRLYVSVPDVLHLQEPPESFFQVPHLYSFSPWTLHLTLWRAGFKIISLRRKLVAPKSGMEITAVRITDDVTSVDHAVLIAGAESGQVTRSLKVAAFLYGSLRAAKRIVTMIIPSSFVESVSIRVRRFVRRLGDFASRSV